MSAPLVLGIDTSTVVTAGLARGTEVLGVAVVDDRLAHVEQLTPLVRRLLADAGLALADVDQLVVGLGPGPFTGLRVGIATARVLAAVTRTPLRGVCSLDVIAAAYAEQRPTGDFLVATDARRREVYWAHYRADGGRVAGPRVDAASALPALPVVGPAAELYTDALQAVPGPRTLDPAVLARLGLQLTDAGTEPLYLRRPDISPASPPKSVLARRRPDSRTP